MSMNIRPGNNDGLFRRLSALPPAIQRAKKLALTRAGLEIQGKAVPWAPVKTGNLRRSITKRQTADTVAVGTNLIYAPPLDRGSYIRAHTRTSAFGRQTKPYQMPGRYQKPYKGRGYLTPAFLIQKRGRFRQIMQEELKAVLRK